MKRPTSARDLAAIQSAERALAKLELDYRAGRVPAQPHRITQALDIGQHYGPEVDIACGAVEPAVDEWEAGQAAPTWEQLLALAVLTKMPPAFFCRPVEANELGPVIMCQRSGKGRGCHVIEAKPIVEPYRPSVTPTPLRELTLFDVTP